MTSIHYKRECPNCGAVSRRCPADNKIVRRDFCSGACEQAFRAREGDLTGFGYAPGGYECRCVKCGDQFTGDKRARNCAKCAVDLRNEAMDQAANGRIASATGYGEPVKRGSTKFVKVFDEEERVVDTRIYNNCLFVATNKRVYRLEDGVLEPLAIAQE